VKTANAGEMPYVARIESVIEEPAGLVLEVMWYYRPEEIKGGRKCFHGEKELLTVSCSPGRGEGGGRDPPVAPRSRGQQAPGPPPPSDPPSRRCRAPDPGRVPPPLHAQSDHQDKCSASSVDGHAKVLTLDDYMTLETVGVADYFSRFRYVSREGVFDPDLVDVYCRCMMPYNPDEMMIGCNSCSEWYHPPCVGMGPAEVEAAQATSWACPSCVEAGRLPVDDDEVDGIVGSPKAKKARV